MAVFISLNSYSTDMMRMTYLMQLCPIGVTSYGVPRHVPPQLRNE